MADSFEEDIERLLPSIVVNDREGRWSDDDEASIAAAWDASDLKKEVDSLWHDDKVSVAWSLSARILGCLPTDIINLKSGLAVASGNKLAWEPAFAEAFSNAIPGFLWEGKPDVLVVVLQYIIINRTNDRRKWVMLTPTSCDSFFSLFATGLADNDGKSVVEVHQMVRESHPEVDFSPFSALFRLIEDSVRSNNVRAGNTPPPILGPSPEAYQVTQADLEVAREVANGKYGGSGRNRCSDLVNALGVQPLADLAWYLEVVGKEALRTQSISARGFGMRCLVRGRPVAGAREQAVPQPGETGQRRRGRPSKRNLEGEESLEQSPALSRHGKKLGRPRGPKRQRLEAPDTEAANIRRAPQRASAKLATEKLHTLRSRRVLKPARARAAVGRPIEQVDEDDSFQLVVEDSDSEQSEDQAAMDQAALEEDIQDNGDVEESAVPTGQLPATRYASAEERYQIWRIVHSIEPDEEGSLMAGERLPRWQYLPIIGQVNID